MNREQHEKRQDEQLASHEKTLAIDPTNADLYVNRARALVWLKRMSDSHAAPARRRRSPS